MTSRASSFIARLTRSSVASAPELVAGNLGHVLNTRKGCGSVIRELGLGDYEAAPNTHAAVLALTKELRAAVLAYEPRLAAPEVTLRGRLGHRTIRFAITGTIDGEAHAFGLDIDTSDRHVDVWWEGGA